MDAIVVEHVVVPAAAITMRAVRSSGPGGQNVNKVSSKVELRVDLARIVGIGAPALARLVAACARAIDAEGRLVVTSQRTRDRIANVRDARRKIEKAIARALSAPRPRRRTAPTRAGVERRLSDKKRRARSLSDRRGQDGS